MFIEPAFNRSYANRGKPEFSGFPRFEMKFRVTANACYETLGRYAASAHATASGSAHGVCVVRGRSETFGVGVVR